MQEFVSCGDGNWYRNQLNPREHNLMAEREYVSPIAMATMRDLRLQGDLDGAAVLEVTGPAEGAGIAADRDHWRSVLKLITDPSDRRRYRNWLYEPIKSREDLIRNFDAQSPEDKDFILQVTRWLLDQNSKAFPTRKLRKVFIKFGSKAHKTLLDIQESLGPDAELFKHTKGTLINPSGAPVPKQFEILALYDFLKDADLVSDLDDASLKVMPC